MENIISIKNKYTYNQFRKDAFLLKKIYPFLVIEKFGSSSLGKDLIAIKFGKGKKEISYSASIHANEWITTVLLMKYVEDFCAAYIKDEYIVNMKATEIFNNCNMYILPMLNPDGVDLVLGDIDIKSNEYILARKIAENFNNIPFPNGWKANIRGIDLNCQFPSMWNKARKIKYSLGYDKVGPRGYVGENPLSEVEAFSLYNFTLRHNFELILSFHTQGEEIYYKYMDYEPKGYRDIAEKFANISNYSLIDIPDEQSYAGYRDWFIEKYNKPGYTIEVGKGVNPLDINQFDSIYDKIKGILFLGMII